MIRRVVILEQVPTPYFQLRFEERRRTVANSFDQFPMRFFRRCSFRLNKIFPLNLQPIFPSPWLMRKTPLIGHINKIIPQLIINNLLHDKLLSTISITLIRSTQILILPYSTIRLSTNFIIG